MLFIASLLAVGWMTSLLHRNWWCHPFCSAQSCLILGLKLTSVYSVMENKNSSSITCMPNFIKIGRLFSLTHTHTGTWVLPPLFLEKESVTYILCLACLDVCGCMFWWGFYLRHEFDVVNILSAKLTMINLLLIVKFVACENHYVVT